MPRIPAIVGAFTAAAVVLTVAPAEAAWSGSTSAERTIADRLAARRSLPHLGNDLAGVVVDAFSGRTVWGYHTHEYQLPASNAKLATAVTALRALGTEHRFVTRVTTGTSRRRVVLVGGGNPELNRSQLWSLAATTARTLRGHGIGWVALGVDDSLFPSPTRAPGWRTSYYPDEISPVRALTVSHDPNMDTSLHTGRVMAAMMHRRGVRVTRVSRRDRPSGADTLAAVRGDSVQAIVTRMLRYSRNDDAEALFRQVALAWGRSATWSGSMAAQRAVLRQLGISPTGMRLYDGSGLSRSDGITPGALSRILRAVVTRRNPRLEAIYYGGALPLSGVSGTLGPDYDRYVTRPTSCARGLIRAKTGSLHDVAALSGVTRGRDGRRKVFSFVVNHVDVDLGTRRALDKLATTVNGCW